MARTEWVKSIATCGPNMLRIECRPTDVQRIGPTFAVKNPKAFRRATLRNQKGHRVFQNEFFTVRFIDDGRKISKSNLEIEWHHDGGEYNWRPTMKDKENLGGNFLSLDIYCEPLIGEKPMPYDPMRGYSDHMLSPLMFIDALRKHVRRVTGSDEQVDHKSFEEFFRLTTDQKPRYLKTWPADVKKLVKVMQQIPAGMLSRSGVTIFLDDSLPWDEKEDWIGRRPKVQPIVLYVLYYGHDYKQGLGMLTDLLGPVPRPPDWVLGVWFSCYREMGEKHYRKLKADFDKHDLPLDVVVVDTDWHKHFWHGFDFNKKLFPQPRRFRDWLKKNKLHAPFNVHPQYIPVEDTRLPQYLKRSGQPLNVVEAADTWHQYNVGRHEVDLFDRKQCDAYMDVFHTPIEKEGGCDMWWVDGVLIDDQGRDATGWMNEMYCQAGRQGGSKGKFDKVVLSRTHGLGAHRSTLHFTGDTLSQWAVLRAEVRLTALASNCLLAYVSHDIGGFYPGSKQWKENKPPDDLMVRWVQFGCLSPIMRLHSDHGIREPWLFGKDALEIIRSFLQLRREMLPYLKHLADEAHETGVGLCRPMYYEYPEAPEAYEFNYQYMLGDAMVVAPVTNPEGMVDMWLPPGDWQHLGEDRIISGPCRIIEQVPLDIAPIYVRTEL